MNSNNDTRLSIKKNIIKYTKIVFNNKIACL